jgi:SOS-response transcriptional repressor LexA
MEQLSIPQHEILRLIHEYIEEHGGRPPYRNNVWFEDRTQYQGNYITNVKGELRKLKYVDDQLQLTEKGREYVRFFFGAFTVRSVMVHVQGTARAGPDDKTYVDLSELDRPSDTITLIPNASLHKDSFAVEVRGSSMEALGILSGDYVIVERQDSL